MGLKADSFPVEFEDANDDDDAHRPNGTSTEVTCVSTGLFSSGRVVNVGIGWVGIGAWMACHGAATKSSFCPVVCFPDTVRSR